MNTVTQTITKFDDKGCLDYQHALTIMTPEEKASYLSKGEKLSITDINSVQSFGQELTKTIADTGDVLLKQVSADPTIEIVAMTNDLLNEIKGLNIDSLNTDQSKTKIGRFFSRMPIIRKMSNKVSTLMTQYGTVKENVDKIADKMMQSKMVAKRDNSTLQEMFTANDAYVKQLRDLILTAKVKMEDAQQTVKEMLEHPENYEIIEIQDAQNFVNSLSKKISNLIVTEHSLTQTKLQIRATQSNNTEIMQKSDEIVTHTLPLWKNELALAITMYNQKASIEAQKKITEATNDMLVNTAKQLHLNSVDVAKSAEEAVISLDTIKTVQEELFHTIDDVQALHEQGELERQEIERSITEFKKQLYQTLSD